MNRNDNLHAARDAKKDEFYTLLPTIEKELKHYRESFRDKVVFCNCDDPEWSAFWKFFNLNSEFLGLKGLISTHYDPVNPTYKLEKRRGFVDVRKTPLQGNNDFRSGECRELMRKADIICTNPPFSLFREYVGQLMDERKRFLIIGNMNAITYKETFPLLKDGKMWLGAGSPGMKFRMDDSYPVSGSGAYVDEDGRKFAKISTAVWFTNMPHAKRNEKMVLWAKYDPEKYPAYDNYPAIEVSRTVEIPMDYDGEMGVPISYLTKHCPDQFEIVGQSRQLSGKGDFTIDGEIKYMRVVIRRKS